MMSHERSLVNAQFIAQLFKLEVIIMFIYNNHLIWLFQMLPESVMDDCIKQLLRAPDERTLKCFCQLIVIVGKKLDHPPAKVYKKEMLYVIMLHCHSNAWTNILNV